MVNHHETNIWGTFFPTTLGKSKFLKTHGDFKMKEGQQTFHHKILLGLRRVPELF